MKVLDALRSSFNFMTPRERRSWATLTILRSALSILDLAGVMAIGFVATSIAFFVARGSDPERVIEFAGLKLAAVNANTLPYAAAIILTLFLSKSVFSVLLSRKSAYFVAQVEARSAKAIAEEIFTADLDSARERSREEIMFAIQVGSPSAFNSLLNSMSTIISEFTLFVLICLGFFLVNPLATLAAIVYFGIVAYIIQLFVGKRTAFFSKRSVRGSIRANVYVSDLIAVFRELSVLGLRGNYIERLYQARLESANSVATQVFLRGMPRYIIEASLLLGISALAVFQALSGNIVESAATLGVFLAGGFRLTGALLPLQSSVIEIQATIPRAQLAQQILRTHSQQMQDFESAKSVKKETERVDGPVGVRLNNVTYTYPTASEPSLYCVNLKIEAGQQAALIGVSGAGKSTIADIVSGVLNPQQGLVEFDSSGVELTKDSLVGRISYVPQKPGLVAGSIAANVALALDEDKVDRALVLKSLERAHLSEVITALPEGIDTDIGNLRDGLSGGQLQRVGLARALYTNPSLLIMDEATSALDAESEAEIAAALNQMRGEVTVLLIAHRLNTIQHSDVVFLVEAGKIRDSGTFKELQQRNDSVSKLVELMKVDDI